MDFRGGGGGGGGFEACFDGFFLGFLKDCLWVPFRVSGGVPLKAFAGFLRGLIWVQGISAKKQVERGNIEIGLIPLRVCEN